MIKYAQSLHENAKKSQTTQNDLQPEPYLFEGNHPDEAPDAGDVGVVEAQQGEDGVGLRESGRGGRETISQTLKTVQTRDKYCAGFLL